MVKPGINSKTEFVTFFKRNILLIVLLFTVITLEININNQKFFVTRFQRLQEHHYAVNEGTLFGFKQVNEQLISEHNDPHVTIRNIDDRIRYVTIQCTNPNPNALSQIFYRKVDEDWAEENSITFHLAYPETTVSLPRTINVTSLRLDLTNREGDVLSCQGLILNPKVEFDLSVARFAFIALLVLGMTFSKKFIPDHFSEMVWARIINDGVWLFILLIILINLAYPITVTYDSAHYLWLADLIRTGDWASWDPIRYPGFPLHIFLSLNIFGYNQEALLYPMILAHVLLFIFSCQIVFDVFKFNKGKERFLISFFIFLFIAMDTTILGYFHTLLTEYLSAIIAVISCSIAIKLYQSSLFSRRFYFLSSFFVIMVPVAWHYKQPYIGASFFPLLIISFLIFLRQISFKTLAYVLVVNLAVGILVILSTLAWNTFLQANGNPMPQHRRLLTKLEVKITDQADITTDGPGYYLQEKFDEYLAISNYYVFHFRSRSVIKNPVIGRGNENTMIAHRMFTNIGQSNLYFFSPELKQFTTFMETTYNPPIWLNTLFQVRIKFSHVLFTLTNLALPIITLLALILWIKEKSTLNTNLLLLSSASLINIFAHIFLIIPNDRYQFWGYVLNLVILTIILVYFGKYSRKFLNKPDVN